MNQQGRCRGCGGVSRLRTESDAGDTNSQCHGYTGGVQFGGGVLIPHVRVVLVLWDHYYITNPTAVTIANHLIWDLVTGSFMNGVAQYGIHRGNLVSTIVLDTASNNPANNFPAPSSWDSGDGKDAKQIVGWINNNTLPNPQGPTPGAPPTVLYFLFMPSTTQLTNGKNPDGTTNTNVCGWHHSTNLSDPDETPVFWALVRTDSAPKTSEQAFVSSIAYCVGHELAEAVTDPDGGGFISSNGCEIGDICELNTFQYSRGFQYSTRWSVEQYWSNWDASCINGDQPVSLRKFCKAIKFNTANGLRSLPLLDQYAPPNTISIDYVADQSFAVR